MIVRVISVILLLSLGCTQIVSGYDYADSDFIVKDYDAVKNFPDSLKFDIDPRARPSSVNGECYAAVFDHAIYLVNLRTGERRPISPSIASNPLYGVCLSAQYVAWISGKSIHLYDIKSHQTRTLIKEEGQPTHLALDGNRIVWSETWKEKGLFQGKWPISNSDIYAYDFQLNKKYVISTASGMQMNPSIQGDLVVWQDNRDSRYKKTATEGCGNCPENRFDIYVFDFRTLKSRAIAKNKRLKSHPVVYGSRIVWEEYQERKKTDIYGYQADLFMFDMRSDKMTRLTETPDPESSPILIGDTLLWHVRTSSDVRHIGANGMEIKPATGIYVMNLHSGQVIRLSTFKSPRAFFDGHRAIIVEWGFSASGRIYTLELN